MGTALPAHTYWLLLTLRNPPAGPWCRPRPLRLPSSVACGRHSPLSLLVPEPAMPFTAQTGRARAEARGAQQQLGLRGTRTRTALSSRFRLCSWPCRLLLAPFTVRKDTKRSWSRGGSRAGMRTAHTLTQAQPPLLPAGPRTGTGYAREEWRFMVPCGERRSCRPSARGQPRPPCPLHSPHLTPGPGGRMRLPAVALSCAAAASELQAGARAGAGLMCT